MADARKIAILIGQSKFPAEEELLDLSFPHSDVRGLKQMLTGTPGKPYDKIHTVLDGQHHEAFHLIEDVVSSLDRDDFVLLYYSGHGLVDRNGRLHLAFENTKQDRIASTSLKVAGLLDVMDSGPARSRLLALDCCYAGAVGAEYNRSGIADQVQAEVRGSGTFIMTASTKIQVAKENPDYGHGIFTKHFIDGLAGAADANGDGTVSAQELYHYVHSRVIDESSQRPRKFNMDGEGVIVLRETGLEPHRDKVLVLRERLFDLARTKMLSGKQLTMALNVVDLEPAKMSPQDKDHFKLLENSLDGDFYPGPYNDNWNRIIAEHSAKLIPKPEPEPNPPPPPEEPELDEKGGSGTAWGLSGQKKTGRERRRFQNTSPCTNPQGTLSHMAHHNLGWAYRALGYCDLCWIGSPKCSAC